LGQNGVGLLVVIFWDVVTSFHLLSFGLSSMLLTITRPVLMVGLGQVVGDDEAIYYGCLLGISGFGLRELAHGYRIRSGLTPTIALTVAHLEWLDIASESQEAKFGAFRWRSPD
jgi:hypothetical protein